MMARSCRCVRRQLSAFHDGELTVPEQIAVEAHLRECRACAAEAHELDTVASVLRMSVSGGESECERLAGLSAGVVSRLKAEQDQSFSGWTGRVFEDLHFVWAALGATGATVACLAVVFGIFYYATHERADSLGGVLAAMALPAGSDENPLKVDGRVLLPTATDSDAFPEAALPYEDESVFALAAVLTREGRIKNLELLHAEASRGNVRSRQDEQAIVNLLGSISKARFEPARYAGAPVAVNMVWLYTQLTVRGKIPDEPHDRPARSISSLLTVDTLAT